MTLFNFAWNNVMRSKRTYLAYFLSCTCSVFVFFSFAVSLFHPNLSVIDSGSTLGLTMGVGNVVVYCFAFMFITYSLNSFLKARMKQFGLLTILGTSKKQLNKIIFLENMVIGILSIITGIIFGIVFAKFFLMLSAKVVKVEDFSMYFPLVPIAVTCILFLLLFLVVSLLIPRMIRRKDILKLLHAENASEKPAKFNLLLTIIGIIAWVALFVLYKNSSDSSSGTYLMIVALIVGTYFLFNQVLGGFLNFIKRRKLYFRSTNMITVSGISLKNRSNSQVMMLVCVLYMISFLAIVALTGLSKNVEVLAREDEPIAFLYVDRGSPEKTSDHLKEIENILKDKEGYKKASFDFLTIGDRSGVISQKDYNNAMSLTGKTEVALDDSSVYLVPGNNYNTNLQMDNKIRQNLERSTNNKLKISGKADTCVITTGYFSQVYVISDANYKNVEKLKKLPVTHMFGYEIKDWNTDNSEYKKFEKLNHKWTVVEGDGSDLGLLGSATLYQVEKQGKNLSLYLGFLLCIVFLLSAASLIYFKLYTELDRECKRFVGIVKMGLSKRELSNILVKEVSLMLMLPFILAFIYMWFGILLLNQTINTPITEHAMQLSSVFIIVQVALLKIVSGVYRKTIFKEVFK